MFLGIIFVIIFLSILILVHEVGHFLAAKKFGLLVEEFGFGLPPKIWGKKKGETVYSVNALPFGGFVKILGENREEDGHNPERNFSFLPAWKRAVILCAGVFFNFLLGWAALSMVFMIGVPSVVVITDVQPASPAAEIGFLAGDKISGFSNVSDFIKYIDENRGKETILKIERNGSQMEFKVTPRINPPVGQGALGIGLVDAGLQKQNFFASFWEGLKTSIYMIKEIFIAIFTLIGKAFVGKASLEQIAGPVGIVKITAQAGSLGFVYLLQLLAMISLNLAVINIFPFPALDGGRLLFLAIEKIKGSPLNHKAESILNGIGFALLILLMIIVTIKDVAKF